MSRYTRREVEALLPAVWDRQAAYGLQNPYAPAPDMPKAATNKAQANTLYAMLADIRTAWSKAPLTTKQRQALEYRFRGDLKEQEIGEALGVHKSNVSRRVEAGIGGLAAWLNGDTYVGDYEPDEEEEDAE